MSADVGQAAAVLLSFQVEPELCLRADGWGDAGGQPILFLHGGGQTRHAWGGAARLFASQGWYAVSLDMRGHGESDWSQTADYSPDAAVRDVAAVVRSFATPPVLVGASWGGLTSMLGLGEGKFPPCKALVLVDIVPKMEPAGVARIRDFMRANLDGFANVEEAADAVAVYRQHRSRPRDARGLLKNLRLRENGRYYWHWDPAFMERRSQPMSDFQERCQRALSRIDTPVLLVRGASSDVVSDAGVADFKRLAPTAAFVDIQGAGHMVAGDRNDAFNQAVLDFIVGLPDAR